MRNRRHGVSKHSSASHFRHNVGRTHPRNMVAPPRRGGWRL